MSKLLDTFQGKSFSSPPLWFMRQAGRYLPEYREVRKSKESFLDLCYSPKDAALVTLQPLERFPLDGAIIFSDILVIPDALGQKVTFIEGKGPQLGPLNLEKFESSLDQESLLKRLSPVYEAIDRVSAALSSDKALLGFCGAPWTLALYMLQGEGSKDFAKAKRAAFSNELLFSHLLNDLVEALSIHLIHQIKAGANAVQIFDSWASHCPATHFQKWIINPTQRLVAKVREVYPETPILGFAKGAGSNLISYSQQTGVSGVSLDAITSLSWAKENLADNLVFQGNLDPILLVSGGDALKRGVQEIKNKMTGRPFIFNLGHGIIPETPPSHVEECIKWVQEST